MPTHTRTPTLGKCFSSEPAHSGKKTRVPIRSISDSMEGQKQFLDTLCDLAALLFWWETTALRSDCVVRFALSVAADLTRFRCASEGS